MATLFLICGLPGAGKTTLSRQLEIERSALRLSPDDWIAAILADASDIAELDRLRAPIESLQWDVALRTLALGTDVILDWGLWSREERTRYRSIAESIGATVEIRALDIDRETLWERLVHRNGNLPPGTFAVTRSQLDAWWNLYEPPSRDELAPPS